MLIEHKYTAKKSFTLKEEVWKKIETEAILEGRMPVLGIHLGDKNLIVLLEDDFEEIIDGIRKL